MLRHLSFVLLLLPTIAGAQESYTLNATAQQAADLATIVDLGNRDTCRRLRLAEGCTQSAACTAAGAVGGSSCTAAQARGSNARIYPATQPGREEYVTFVIAAPPFLALRADISTRGKTRYCQVWWPVQNQTTKDGECSKLNLPNGCELCP